MIAQTDNLIEQFVFRMPCTLPVKQTVDTNKPALEELNSLLSKTFYKPDLQAVRIVLGAIEAHRLRVGDPAWIFVVAPPGSGKTTTTIMGTCGLPDVIPLGDFSENTFLSGFYGHKEPGLLEKLGTTTKEGNVSVTTGDGVFVAKDFTTVLSMRREKRGAILGQLREIHDGEFKRDFGTGESKVWRGKVTIIAAVTPVLDRHYSVFSVLGERFLQVRWHRPDSAEAGVWAIKQQGNEDKVRKSMQEIVKRIFMESACTPPILEERMQTRIASIAEIVAIARTHVERSSYGNREIEFVPESEGNPRIAKALAAIARGVAALHGRKQVSEQDLQDCFRVGLDSLPERRRRLFLELAAGKIPASPMARTTRERELEEMAELGIVRKNEKTEYELSDKMARHWAEAGVE
jgi:hypothetical protein